VDLHSRARVVEGLGAADTERTGFRRKLVTKGTYIDLVGIVNRRCVSLVLAV
jgi:hypothetical protein